LFSFDAEFDPLPDPSLPYGDNRRGWPGPTSPAGDRSALASALAGSPAALLSGLPTGDDLRFRLPCKTQCSLVQFAIPAKHVLPNPAARHAMLQKALRNPPGKVVPGDA
jgi:hypothetical protein